MTAQTVPGALAARGPANRPFAGLTALLRKDTTEWLRGRRAWVVLAVSVAFMTLTAANAWIVGRIAALVPAAEAPEALSLAPLDNLMAAVGTQLFVVATILAVGSLVVAERQAGTLAWVASKPVSRRSIWLSKWISATALLALTAVVLPLAATVALVAVLYGVPDPAAIAAFAAGMIAMVVLFTAVGITAGVVLPGQAGVTATGLAVFILLPVIGGILPGDLAAVLPTSILAWTVGLATGAPVSLVTPIAFVAVVAAIAAVGLWRMDRLEL